jgi:hypothetical protein
MERNGMKRMNLTIVALGFMASAALWGHDARLHQANATTGEITSVSADSFDLKTAKGNFKVTYSTKTKFEHDGKAVDKTHLTKGTHAGVLGTKLPTGELVAKEVLLGISDSADEPKGKAKAATEHKH